MARVSWLLALAAALVEPAFADPGEVTTNLSTASASREASEARERFREASNAAESGQWELALGLYRSAYATYPHATTLYNIAYCHGQLGQPARALYYATRALDPAAFEADRRLAGERHAEAQKLQRLLFERVGAVTVSVEPALPFTLRVDGAALVLTGTPDGSFVPHPEALPVPDPLHSERVVLQLDSGSHELVLATEGRTYARSVEVVAGQTFALPWSLEPAPEARTALEAKTAPEVKTAPEAKTVPETKTASATDGALAQAPLTAPESNVYGPLAIASFAVGGAGLGLALVSGIVVLKTGNYLESEPECDDGVCPEAESKAVNRYQTAAQLTNVGLWTGVAGGALGVGFLLLDRAHDARRVTVVAGPSRVELRGTF